jgi:MYXO-CTERM domain-containing protein
MRTFLISTASLTALLISSTALAATHKVGPAETFKTPCAAMTDAMLGDGDTIEIDSSVVYTNDYCALEKSNITLRGVGGARAKIDAMLGIADMLPDPGAIWVLNGANTVIENVEITGATTAAQNGAGIHVAGAGVTIRGSHFHNNQYGVRVADGAGEVLIELSELGNNGTGTPFGDNINVGKVKKFTLQNSYLHHVLGGTLVTSFAEQTHILYNRLTDENDGAGQYQIDLPVGGSTFIIGNIVHKSEAAAPGDNVMISYARASSELQPSQDLFVVNNTLVSNKIPGTIFIDASTPGDKPPVVRNNIFVGPGTPCTVPEAVEPNNITMGDPMFADAANFDYHLKEGSPAIDKGADPGTGLGVDLTPKSQYAHPAMTENRPVNGAIDIGAYEVAPVGMGGAGGGGGSGMGGAGGSGMGGSGGSDTGGAGGSGTGGAGTGGSMTGGDEGCGCRVGETGSPQGAAVVVAGLALLFARRRRNGSTGSA